MRRRSSSSISCRRGRYLLDTCTRWRAFWMHGLWHDSGSRRLAIAHEELDGLEALRLRFARVVDIEVVEEAARDVAAGGPQPRAVRIVVGARDHEQELGEGQVGRDGGAVRRPVTLAAAGFP